MIMNSDWVIVPMEKPMTLTEIYEKGQMPLIADVLLGGEKACYFFSSLDQYKNAWWKIKAYPVMIPLSLYIQFFLCAEGLDTIGIDPEVGRSTAFTDKKKLRKMLQEANREDEDEE